MIRFIKGLYHLLIAVFSVLWFRFPSRKLTIIGITGTDGKTTTSTLVYEILKKAKMRTSMISSVHAVIAGKTYDTGFHVTTPNAYFIQKYLREAVDHGDTHIVLEVTSHALSQYRVFGVRFFASILTNVTHEHLDWHRTYDNYLTTKLSLLRKSHVAIINRDEAHVYNRALRVLKNKNVITFGKSRSAMIKPSTIEFHTKLPGEYNQYNCLAAIACGNALGIKRSIIQMAIAEFRGIKGRMEIIQHEPVRVIVDFAHTPNGLEQALRTARESTKRRLIHVFGSAGDRDKSKRPVMGRISEKYADLVVLTEEDYRMENVESIINEISLGIQDKKKLIRHPNRKDAIQYALNEARYGDTVILTGKGHEMSLCRGKIEYPWSDQAEVRNILQQLLR